MSNPQRACVGWPSADPNLISSLPSLLYMNNTIVLDTMESQSNGDNSEEEEVEEGQSSIRGGQHYTFSDDEWNGDYHPSFESDSYGLGSLPRT